MHQKRVLVKEQMQLNIPIVRNLNNKLSEKIKVAELKLAVSTT